MDRVQGAEPAVTRFRVLTAVTAVSVWLLVAVGGVVRVTGSGLGCPHWPLCTARALPLDNSESVIEYLHRVVVAWVSLLVIAVAVVAWRRFRQRRDLFISALVALALLPFQAVLGAVAVWWDLAGAMVAYHFVLGMLFLAATTVTAASAWRPPRPRAGAGFVWVARTGVLVGLALVSVGAAVVAAGADSACGAEWPSCNGGFATGGGDAVLQVTHRMLAYLLAIIAAILLWLALRRRGPRLAGALPVVVVLIQIGLGVGVVLSGGNAAAYRIFSGAHVAGAGLVWGLLVVLATRYRGGPSPAGASATEVPAAVGAPVGIRD